MKNSQRGFIFGLFFRLSPCISGNDPCRPELRKQAEKHLVGGPHGGESGPTQLAAIAKHIVIPAKHEVGKLSVIQLQNIAFHQPASCGEFAPYRAVVRKQLLK